MDRFTQLFIGGVLAVVVAGLATAVFGRGHDADPDLSTPGGVVLAYSLALQRQDYQTAWNLLSTSVQARNDHARYLARPAVTDTVALSIDEVRIDGETARVTLVRTFPARGLFGEFERQTRDNVVLTRESDGWRITVPYDYWPGRSL